MHCDFIFTKNFNHLAKIVHILCWMSWMAGLLYLPRLFVYHAQVSKSSDVAAIFSVMERRLYNYIMYPAMITTILSGAALSYLNHAWIHKWWHIKLLMVSAMMFLHWLFGKHAVRLMSGSAPSATYFRFINEVPALLFIVITAMVVLKPFRN